MLAITAVKRLSASLLVIGSTSWLGCRQAAPQPGPDLPPVVKVTSPVSQELSDFVEFTGRTEAAQSVEVRARVSGYLQNILFQAGSEVQSGDALFQIDSRIYETEVARSEGSVAMAIARNQFAKAEFDRTKALRERQVTSQADFEKITADLAQSEAAIQLAEASLRRAKLDFEFTKVVAPISGRTSRERITPGNLVAADSTLLTTIVSLDPMFVHFDVDERTMLQIMKMVREGKLPKAQSGETPIRLGLANEEGFPHEGSFSLTDNSLSSATGTIQVRATFPNPGPNHELLPGLFVRVQVSLGAPRARWLVPDEAIGQMQSQRFVYVVKADNTIERRNVTMGKKEGDLRVIEVGLEADDRVVVQGQLRVRPGMTVNPQPFAAVVDKPQ